MQIEKCEICGKQFIAGYGYSIAATWLVTGHALVRAFMCPSHPSGQHWGCSPEHAMQALINCINDDEHMSINSLMKKHESTEKPRYSEEDSEWIDKSKEDFHIVRVIGEYNVINDDKI